MIERNDYRLPQGRKISRFLCVYDENTKLDAEVAKEVFALSYMAATLYNYREEPTTSYTGKLIVRHRMFIIIFLELLVNRRIKYEIS